jgi:topoisomerase IV subunit A
MKAMGNRLSAHVVQTVELIAEHDDAADVPDPAPDSVEATEIIQTPEDKTTVDAPPAADTPVNEVAEEKPAKKIDLEITNPDDIDIDDKGGQLGLF